GKSTLLRIAGGVLRPDDGVLRIDETEVQFDSVRSAQEYGIELLSQPPAIFPQLSIVENICVGVEPTTKILGIRLLERAEMRKRAGCFARDFGIDETTLKRPVSFLSQGQQALVGFTRAISKKPKVLALDEPTAALGYRERATVNHLIGLAAAEGVAVLLVTHILKDALDLSNRFAILKEGRVVFLGESRETSEAEIIRYLIA
ncbi:MAG: ATP-binding cassette domain-containing protein, partial [Acidobacteriia bacterium]|nr:ATP-binding cassette domain-containing protein [Terriglobia bacterium]